MDKGVCEIFEVGPRDGLQNEAREIPVAEKVALVDLLSQTRRGGPLWGFDP
jgi:hydroxymethylglutaryl-CoA lyase